ncbi:MAG TPA: sporulation protein [Chthonomonadales bacterium]|nr:sporulation protein [Chthonomonadales bacterium]
MLERPLRLIAGITGFGAPGVDVVLPQRASPRGSLLSGVVVLRGGIVPMRVYSIRAQLDAYDHERDRMRRSTIAETTLGGGITLMPRERREFPLDLRIPDDARLTHDASLLDALLGDGPGARTATANPQLRPSGGRPSPGGSGCLLEAWLDIGWWAARRSDLSVLNIVEHREVVAIGEVIEALGFQRARRLRLKPPDERVYVRDYDPPRHVADRLGALSLTLRIEGSDATCTLDLNRPNRGLIERLRALIGADRARTTLRFARETLLTEDGEPDGRAARPVVEEALSAVLAVLTEAGDPRWTLLRPAGAPTDGVETLLRPAAAAHRQDDGTLLRPAGPRADSAHAPASDHAGNEGAKPDKDPRASTGEDPGR